MPRRVFVVSGEYSANPRYLTSERRSRDWLSQPHPELDAAEVSRLFFRFPNRGEDGRAGPDDWRRDFGLESPISLTDLFASAAHRALTSLQHLKQRAWNHPWTERVFWRAAQLVDPSSRLQRPSLNLQQ